MSEIIYRIVSVAFLTFVASTIMYFAYLGFMEFLYRHTGIDYLADEDGGDEV